MNVSFRQLKAFIEVARFRSFTKAAEALHITQAGLSITIRQLETQLDCRLFDRTTKTVSLTPSGEQFLAVAKRTVTDLEEARKRLHKSSALSRKQLSVGVTPLVSASIFPVACQTFNEQHPEGRVNVTAADHDQIQRLVKKGLIDFGLGANFKTMVGISQKALFKYQLMWVAPDPARHKQYPSLSSGEVPWQALRDLPILGLPADNRIQRMIDERLAAIGRETEERLTFNNFETLIAMVSTGTGTTILPSYAIEACRRHGVQTAILVDPLMALDFYQITKRGREAPELMPHFVRAFIDSVPGRYITDS